MPEILPILGALLPDDLRPLVESAPLPGLQGTSEQTPLRNAILDWEREHTNKTGETRFPDELQDLVLASLWLLEGDLDSAHTHAQKWDSLHGCCWHAIMHRREGDWDNAKYWYQRASKSPVISNFRQTILTQHYYRIVTPELVRPVKVDEFLDDWVDIHQKAVQPSAPENLVKTLRGLDWIEWQLLLAHCFHVIR